MKIKIETEKIKKHGMTYRKVVGIEMLELKDLPKEYVNSGECAYLVPGETIINPYNKNIRIPYLLFEKLFYPRKIYYHDQVMGIHEKLYLIEGGEYTESEFLEKLKIIYRCAERLKKIKDKNRVKEIWEGYETFII